MYRIKGIHIDNFRGFREERLHFPDVDIVILAGSNGFGKTSFFDGVEWGFTGNLKRYDNTSRERNAESFLKNACSSSPGKIEITLTDGKEDFSFSRTTKIERGNDFNEGILNIAQEDLEQKLIKPIYHGRYSLADVFNFSHLLSQELINQFVRGFKANERYNVLSSLIGLQEYYKYQDCLKVVDGEVSREVKRVESSLFNLRKEKEKLEALIDKEVTEYGNVDEEYQKSIKDFNQLLDKDCRALSPNEFLKEINNTIGILESKRVILSEQKQKLTKILAGLPLHQEKQSKLASLKGQMDKLKNLHSNLKGLEKLKFVKDNWEIYSKYLDKHDQIEELVKQIGQFEQFLNVADDVNLTVFEKLSTFHKFTQLFREDLSFQRIKKLNDDYTNLVQEVNRLTQKINTLDELISQLGTIETEILKNAHSLFTMGDETDKCPVCLTPVKVKELLEQLKKRLENNENLLLSWYLTERQELYATLNDIKSQQNNLESKAMGDLAEYKEQVKRQLERLKSTKTELEEKITISDNVRLVLQDVGIDDSNGWNLDYIDELEGEISSKVNSNQLNSKSVEDKIKDLEREMTQYAEVVLTYENEIERLKIGDIQEGTFKIGHILKANLSKISEELEGLERKLMTLRQINDTVREVIKFTTESVNISKLKEVESQIQIYGERQKYLHKLQQYTRDLESKVPEVINQMTKDILDKYRVTVNEFYRLLNPQPLFTMLDWEISKSHKNGTLVLKSSTSDKQHSVNPSFTFSSAQVNIVALSFFLSFALQQQWSNLDCIFMDDPIQNMDDINIFSFVDVIRSLCFNNGIKKQIFLSTHDQRFLKFMLKKFRMLKVLVLNYHGYGESGPKIEKVEYF